MRGIKRSDFIREAQFVAGMVVMASAYPMFLLANDIAPGGVSGVAMVLHRLIGVPVGLTTFVLNLPLFAIGYRQRGKPFVIRSFIAMAATSFMIDGLKIATLTSDPMLASFGGGVTLGIGLGLVLRTNATTGGSDMAAMLIHRRFPLMSVGGVLLAIDCVVVLGAGIVFEPQAALYSLVALFISTRVMDRVVEGFDTAKAIIIISDEHAAIAGSILEQMERGVTLLASRGAYSGAQRDTLLCVVTRTQVPQLKRVVNAIDPKAFMIVADVSEAMGEGFEKIAG